jgi:hypothetical protein
LARVSSIGINATRSKKFTPSAVEEEALHLWSTDGAESMGIVKGMVQVAGSTYRVVRIEKGVYEVIRILDDARVGIFRCAPFLEITPFGIEGGLLKAIARAAVQGGKTSWVGRLSFA